MHRFTLPLLLALMLLVPAIASAKKTETISLPGLQCVMCKNTIESRLADLEGLESITVDVENLNAVVVFDETKLTLAQIETAITKIGYDANEKKANFKAQSNLNACCQPGGDR